MMNFNSNHGILLCNGKRTLASGFINDSDTFAGKMSQPGSRSRNAEEVGECSTVSGEDKIISSVNQIEEDEFPAESEYESEDGEILATPPERR